MHARIPSDDSSSSGGGGSSLNTSVAALLYWERRRRRIKRSKERRQMSEPIDSNGQWITPVLKEELGHQLDQGPLYACLLGLVQPVTFTQDTCTTDTDKLDVVPLNTTHSYVTFETIPTNLAANTLHTSTPSWTAKHPLRIHPPRLRIALNAKRRTSGQPGGPIVQIADGRREKFSKKTVRLEVTRYYFK